MTKLALKLRDGSLTQTEAAVVLRRAEELARCIAALKCNCAYPHDPQCVACGLDYEVRLARSILWPVEAAANGEQAVSEKDVSRLRQEKT